MNELNELANSPNNPEKIQLKMNNLWNQLQAIKAQKVSQRESAEVWRTVREQDTAHIAKVKMIYDFYLFNFVINA